MYGKSALVKFVVVVLLLVMLISTEGKRKKKKSLFKDRSNKGKDSPKYQEPEVEEIKYSSDEEKSEILARLQREHAEKANKRDERPSDEEMAKLKLEERELRSQLVNAVMAHGNLSKQKATILHKVGRNLFKQSRFDDTWDISQEILHIHETLDGPESFETALALSNAAQVAYRTGRRKECGYLSYRYLYIMLKEKGPESKEAVLARARLAQYHFPDGQTSKGMSYDEYLKEKEKSRRDEEDVEL